MKKRKPLKAPKGRNSWQAKEARQNRRDSTDAEAQSPYWWPPDKPKMNCAWFYIPLRIPLELPDRFTVPIGSPHNFDYPDQDFTELIGFMGSPENPFGVSTSICVHQIEGNTNNPQLEAAMTASQRRPWIDKPDNVGELHRWSRRTGQNGRLSKSATDRWSSPSLTP